MEKLFELKLIDSTYTADDAKEVIITLINHKIQFLGLKKLQIIEQKGGDTSHIESRIAELDAARTELRTKIDSSEDKTQEFKISSNVNVQLLEKETV